MPGGDVPAARSAGEDGSPLVPGPPRGRRRVLGGSARQRIEAVAAAELAGAVDRWAAMLELARDVILLVKDLAADPRVTGGRRWTPAGLAVAYVMSPVDLVPDWIPVLGQLDDILVLGWAARRLLREAGYDIIYEHWRGTDEGLAVLLTLAGVQD